jgi:ribosomal protein S16
MRFKLLPQVAESLSKKNRSGENAKTVGTVNPDDKSYAISSKENESDGVTLSFQHGVQSAQAVTQLWSTKHLVMAYIMSVSTVNHCMH